MSEYENAKRVVKQMRLGKTQAQDLGARAFEADLKRGRPDIALKCAREFKLSDDHLTRAATALFTACIARKMYAKALEIARSYNLAHGGGEAQAALARASGVHAKIEDDEAAGAIAEIRRMSARASSARVETSEADEAIELLKAARVGRDKDPRVKGRAVYLPAKGEVWLTGDLHGNVDNLKRFAALADLGNHPERILIVQEIVHARLITADNRDLSFIAIMEAIRLMAQFPGRVYYLLGNHDLAVHLDRELVKGGKYLNRYLFRGMSYMYRGRSEDVLAEYRKFIGGMPAAVFTPNGVFMAHSTPKKPFIPSLSRAVLEDGATSLKGLRPIAAMVNGREYSAEAADAFADRLEVDVMLCGHTPTGKGVKVPSHRHLIIDSQHEKARYVRFDLATRYDGAADLLRAVSPLNPENETVELTAELM